MAKPRGDLLLSGETGPAHTVETGLSSSRCQQGAPRDGLASLLQIATSVVSSI